MKQLPIWRDANRLLLEVEQAVRGFSRYHKYSVGTDLRRQSMGIVRLLSRAYHAEGDRRGQVRRLVFAVDDIEVLIQLAKELRAAADVRPASTGRANPAPPGFTPVLRNPLMRRCLLWFCAVLLVQPVVAQTCRDDITPTAPDSRFIVYDDEVTDKITGLVWQRCSLGQTGSDCSGGSTATYTWQGALQAAAAERTATGLAWRLPNLNELQSIVERRCFAPAINASVFPNRTASYYWSGSPAAHDSGHAWYVDFYYGHSNGYNKDYGYGYVRLVRGGQ